MKIYLAGADVTRFWNLINEAKGKNVLINFFYFNKGKFDEFHKYGFDVFIDSGGFSARTSGVEINIKEYGDFLIDKKDKYTIAANLDTSNKIQTLENQDYLESLGVKILPVYHLSDYIEGDKKLLLDWLKKYEYIALGGTSNVSKNVNLLKNFFNFCFKNGLKEGVKFHGFGVTDFKFLTLYPFYSCDSTTYQSGGRFGTVFVYKNFKLKGIHYSEKQKVLKNNIPIDILDDWKGRVIFNIQQTIILQNEVTELWRKRGINYET